MSLLKMILLTLVVTMTTLLYANEETTKEYYDTGELKAETAYNK